MEVKKSFITEFFNSIPSLLPFILGLLWLFNVYYIGNNNDITIKELKSEIREIKHETQNISREIEIIKTTIKLKVK